MISPLIRLKILKRNPIPAISKLSAAKPHSRSCSPQSPGAAATSRSPLPARPLALGLCHQPVPRQESSGKMRCQHFQLPYTDSNGMVRMAQLDPLELNTCTTTAASWPRWGFQRNLERPQDQAGAKAHAAIWNVKKPQTPVFFQLDLKHTEFGKRVNDGPCAVSCREPHGLRDNQGHRGDRSPALGTLCESLFFTFWQTTSDSKDFPEDIKLRKSGELAGTSHTRVNARAPPFPTPGDVFFSLKIVSFCWKAVLSFSF